MTIKIELDQKAMSKSRKFVKFNNSELLTVPQAQTVFTVLNQLGITVINNTGLQF